MQIKGTPATQPILKMDAFKKSERLPNLRITLPVASGTSGNFASGAHLVMLLGSEQGLRWTQICSLPTAHDQDFGEKQVLTPPI